MRLLPEASVARMHSSIPSSHVRQAVHACALAPLQVEAGEVAIRRRPPHGIDKQAVGPMDFRVNMGDDNQPRNILEEIVWHKAVEIEQFRAAEPLARLRQYAAAAEPARDFRSTLLAKLAATQRPGLIAEVKKASPSRGVIQPNFDPVAIARAYEAGGAACLSVLTDAKFFQGSFDNLKAIRAAGVKCPLLCKEFIVDAYQIMKARANGADAILLIVAVLPNSDLEYFTKAARALGMQCLIEVHSEAELQRTLQVRKRTSLLHAGRVGFLHSRAACKAAASEVVYTLLLDLPFFWEFCCTQGPACRTQNLAHSQYCYQCLACARFVSISVYTLGCSPD